ncbi:MAG: ATP-binding protein [bacterium]
MTKDSRQNNDSADKKQELPKQDAAGQASAADTELYYRRLRQRLHLGLLAAYMVPLVILSLYFHLQFNYTLKKSGKIHLITLAESQRNTIDLFLQERVVNIFNLLRASDFKLPPAQVDMWRYLQNLREMSDAFIDVGFLDASGVQIGYAGPYPYLQGRNYSNEEWFKTLMKKDKNYHISDVYLGFRKKPHFTIAIKQLFEGKPYIMRATLDPDKFYLFLRTIGKGKSKDSALINHVGRYQIVDPDRGELLGRSDYKPAKESGSDATEIGSNGDTELVAYAWLEEAPWALIVRQPLGVAYAEMYQARRVMIAAMAGLVLVIITIIWLITNRLLWRAQMMEQSRKELKSQLFHAAKLVAVGELAGGVAHEINNPLAIISSESGLIRDMLDPQFGIECTPEKIRKELDRIDEAVFRTRDITHKLLKFVRKTEPRLVRRNINAIVDDVVSGLMERELEVSNIKLVRNFDPEMPNIMTDPDQLRQVFLNILNNASDAIDGAGTITIATSHDDDTVRATITDTGKGMTSEQMEKIFLPFYTTKEPGRGTGLGLSVSLSITQTMGGRIEVQSMPGAGSSFTVVLPLYHTKEDA